jgi:hypothetical protein
MREFQVCLKEVGRMSFNGSEVVYVRDITAPDPAPDPA